MDKNIKKHPALQNPQIFAVRNQQVGDSDNFIKQQEMENDQIISVYLPILLKIYTKHKVKFHHITDGFDNVCYNLIFPIFAHYTNILYQKLQKQFSVIDIYSFQNNVIDSLLNILFDLSYKTLWYEFREFVIKIPEANDDMTENEVNEIFVAEYEEIEQIQNFFLKYPVLARLICETSDIWLNKHKLIFDFLSEDIFTISKYFNLSFDFNNIEIQKLTISGDNHDKTDFVAIILFAENQKIVLKNRTAKPDKILAKTIDYLINKHVDLQYPKLLEIQNHYWMEFIENKPCSDENEFSQYYERIGNLAGLLYALNGQDIHYENVIANGVYPIIIDAECLFSNSKENGYSNNLLHIGLLPADHIVGEKEIWVGGTDNASEQDAPFNNWMIDENYNEKDYTGKFKNANNSPFIESGLHGHSIDYIHCIEKGFSRVYDIINENKDKFISIVKNDFPVKSRFLFRPTYSYNYLIRQSIYPNYLNSIFSYNWVFEWLWINEEVNPKYNSLIPYEQDVLKQRLIPYFYSLTNSKDLYITGRGLAAANFFEQNAEESFLNKINSFSGEDKSIQLEILRLQFLKLSNKNEIQLTSDDFILQVVNEIRKSLFPVMNTIESFDFIDGDVKKVKIDFYDGYAGRLFFLIYYRYINKDNSVDDLIDILFKKILFEIKNHEDRYGVGAYIGLSGCLFTFTNLYSLDSKSEYLESIFFIQDIIQKKVSDFNHNYGFDILSGISGCIICLDHFNKIVPNQKTEKLIINCSEILLNNYIVVSENSIGWASKMGIPLVGYSHGCSGIGHALLIAYQISKEEKYKNLFYRCLMFEKEHYNNEKKVWEDEREDVFKNTNTSWCNGTTGIGLARLFFQKHSKSFNFKKEIESTLKTNIQFGITVNDVLCHGNSGTLEFLLSYYQINNNEKTMGFIKQITNFLLQKIDNNEIKCNNKNNMLSLSFMTGLSGIAYEILRIKNPELTTSPLFLHYSAIN